MSTAFIVNSYWEASVLCHYKLGLGGFKVDKMCTAASCGLIFRVGEVGVQGDLGALLGWLSRGRRLTPVVRRVRREVGA